MDKKLSWIKYDAKEDAKKKPPPSREILSQSLGNSWKHGGKMVGWLIAQSTDLAPDQH